MIPTPTERQSCKSSSTGSKRHLETSWAPTRQHPHHLPLRIAALHGVWQTRMHLLFRFNMMIHYFSVLNMSSEPSCPLRGVAVSQVRLDRAESWSWKTADWTRAQRVQNWSDISSWISASHTSIAPPLSRNKGHKVNYILVHFKAEPCTFSFTEAFIQSNCIAFNVQHILSVHSLGFEPMTLTFLRPYTSCLDL